MFDTTWWLCRYWLRRIDVREGQHSESVTVWLVNVMPSLLQGGESGDSIEQGPVEVVGEDEDDVLDVGERAGSVAASTRRA